MDVAYSIVQTADGGYAVAGDTYSKDGDISGCHESLDGWVVKIDSAGNIEWQKCLGGSHMDSAHSIVQTADGGYVVAGFANSKDGDVSGHFGDRDYWVVKLDSGGDIKWQKCLGGSDEDEANSIIQTSDGCYVVAGYLASEDDYLTGNHEDGDYWVVKLGPTGNVIWQKNLGGSKWDEAESIIQTSDGGYIVAGSSSSDDGDVTGAHGYNDYWVVKLDSTGNMEWQKSLGGSKNDEASDIIQTSDGNYIVVGTAGSDDGDLSGNNGGSGCWVVKLDSSGNIIWQKSLGGSGSSIVQASDGNYIVAGNNGDYWIVKLDTSGNIIWQKSLGGSDSEGLADITLTSDGWFAVAGYTWSNDGDVSGSHGDREYWVVKLTDAEGIVSSTVQPSGPSSTVTQEATSSSMPAEPSAPATQAPLGLYTCLAALCVAVCGSILMRQK